MTLAVLLGLLTLCTQGMMPVVADTAAAGAKCCGCAGNCGVRSCCLQQPASAPQPASSVPARTAPQSEVVSPVPPAGLVPAVPAPSLHSFPFPDSLAASPAGVPLFERNCTFLI